MAKFLDYDPLRGVAQYEDEYDGRLQIHYRQDVEPVLELAKHERNHGLADRAGKKEDLYLYARIPAVTILELKYKYGVDIFQRDHLPRAMEIINRDYPALKCTDKVHNVRGAG